MDGEVMIFAVVYALFAACVIFPPTEFASSGLTVEGLLTALGLLGSEDIDFVGYHARRTAATALIHSALPTGFFLGLSAFSVSEFSSVGWMASNIHPLLSMWSLGLLASICLTTVVCLVTLAWRMDRWSRHPLAKTLALYAEGRSPWTTVASNVNAEFRRIDKFASNANGGPTSNRVIVTDSWLIGVTTYAVHLVHQGDVNMAMTDSQEVDVTHLGSTGVQILTLNVESTRRGIRPFSLRLNSREYADFKEKLRSPVLNARRIVVHLTLSDRFVNAFKDQVQLNPRYVLQQQQSSAAAVAVEDENMESCIGCMQTPHNVKLQRLCVPPTADQDVECRNCYCRPMWCVDCMGKWFASRQDQERPATWLAGRSPCPTCRATFCMLDVCLVQRLPTAQPT